MDKETVLNAAAIIVPAAYEVGVRLFPTKKNISILGFLMAVFNAFIPNRKKDSIENHTF
jgi:hypothetical protein